MSQQEELQTLKKQVEDNATVIRLLIKLIEDHQRWNRLTEDQQCDWLGNLIAAKMIGGEPDDEKREE